MVKLAKAMMHTGGYQNAILIDYSTFCCNYFKVSDTIAPQIGRFIADFITSIGLKPDLVDMVGHSLGAHICGYTGNSLIGRGLGMLNKIVGELQLQLHDKTKIKFKLD